MADAEELNKRLREVELQVARMESHIKSELSNLRLSLNKLHDGIDKVGFSLHGDGNGNMGLRGRLVNLESMEQSRLWHFRALWVAALATIGTWIATIIGISK